MHEILCLLRHLQISVKHEHLRTKILTKEIGHEHVRTRNSKMRLGHGHVRTRQRRVRTHSKPYADSMVLCINIYFKWIKYTALDWNNML